MGVDINNLKKDIMANEALQADAIRQLLDLGVASAGKVISEHGGTPVILAPPNFVLKELPQPTEKVRRTVGFNDVESFVAYVNRFKTPGTLLFATVTDTDCKIVAHIDHHDKPVLPGRPFPVEWSSHLATLVCVQTKEWKTWMSKNGKDNQFKQEEFAQFLEDNERLFRSPDAANLLELVTTLEGKNNVRYNSAVRLSNGRAKLDYEEDVELRGGVGTGAIEIPTELICAIIPFENGPEPYEVRSRLRYRLQNRSVVFWYETVTPHLVLRDAAKAVMDSVREKVASPLLIGG